MTAWADLTPEQKARKYVTDRAYRERDRAAARERSRKSYQKVREERGFTYTRITDRVPVVKEPFIGPKRPVGRPRKEWLAVAATSESAQA